mgnify:CR=1 FL=1
MFLKINNHIKKTTYNILICILFIGCSKNEEVSFYNISDYQGVWRDTIFNGADVYVEDLIIKENSMKYTLFDVNTHVVLDTLIGTILLGSENKMGWNCISPITNDIRQLYWNVLSLSPYRMNLYSDIQGEHNYRKVYHSTIEEYLIQDTLMEMLRYKQYLPLHKDELVEKFGSYNRLLHENEIVYYTHHPLFTKILFMENMDYDSIYSYAFSVKEWSKCNAFISSYYTKLRSVGSTTEYIDGESLDTSENIIIAEPNSKQIRFSPIKDYDYWPNVSHYLGRHLQKFMDDYSTKYVYEYQEDKSSGLRAYQFLTKIDSIYSDFFVVVDSTDIVKRSGVTMFKTFTSNKKKEAQKELDRYASFLSRKYFLNKTAWDENGNKIYYYYPCQNSQEAAYEIRLMLVQYSPNKITKTYQVRVFYVQL